MTSIPTKSVEECSRWVQHVHNVQTQRSPEAVEAARRRIEQARQHEVSYRKCKAVKGHSVRSRALACEGLRQMASSAPQEQMAVQGRWKSAQQLSNSKKESSMGKVGGALSAMFSSQAESRAEILRDASDSEDEAMAEVANIVGAVDVRSMAAVGAEGVERSVAGIRNREGNETNTVEALLSQLRKEPKDEAECSAKFMLYEGYASEVEQIRGDLFKFHEENGPTLPRAVVADMDKQVRSIDSTEAMGIHDGAREWFVYHMMRQAEKNNKKMAGILDSFEKKLQFLASNDQAECPICLESFSESGLHAPETLGCCHKVCKDCWANWTSMMRGRSFCPLCRNEEFLGAVAERVSGATALDDEL